MTDDYTDTVALAFPWTADEWQETLANQPAGDVNVDLLTRTLGHIEAHPEEWNQSTWRCGTAACFAGHAAILAGATWAGATWSEHVLEFVRTPPAGSRSHVGDYAAEQLGLARDVADELFMASNTLADLRLMVAGLIRHATPETTR